MEMSHIELAVQLKTELDGLRPLTAEQEQRVWQKFRFDWNYHSNNIEGNSLTFGETKSLLLHNITAQGKPLKDHIEITGHNEAIDALLELTRGALPLTEAFVRELHRLILRERYPVAAVTAEGAPTKKWVEVGRYKSTPNHVLTATGELFQFAEPIDVPGKMHSLVAAANALQGSPAEAVLIAAAKLHYDLVLIHPFDDGNGRIARLLMNLLLIKHGFPPAIVKTEDKNNYFAALRQADGGQLEIFVEYIAGCVCQSLKIMLAGARGEDLDEPGKQDRQIKMLERLLESKKGVIADTRTGHKVGQLYDHCFAPLVRRLNVVAAKFRGMYASIAPESTISGITEPIDIALDSKALCFPDVTGANVTGAMTLYTDFSSLKFQGYDHFSYLWFLSMHLHLSSYSVTTSARGPEITKNYGEFLSDAEMENIVTALTKNHIQAIEQATGVSLDQM